MDVDAVIRREPELALIDELAHTNAPGHAQREALPGHRRDARRRDRRDLDRQHPASREPERPRLRAHRRPRPRDLPGPDPRRGGRGRPRRPHAGGAPGTAARREGLRPRAGRDRADELLPARQPRRAARARAARAGRGRRGAAGRPTVLDPLSQQAVAERDPRARRAAAASQRIIRRAFRSAQRLGAELDALWVRRPGSELDRGGGDLSSPRCAGSPASSAPTSSRREGDNLSTPSGAWSRERGSTYIFVGTPDESRRREILGGSLRLQAGARAARHRHPRGRRPRAAGRGAASDASLLADRLAGPAVALACARVRARPRSTPDRVRSASSSRSPAARSTRPCSTPRSGSRAPRTRRSSPAYLIRRPARVTPKTRRCSQQVERRDAAARGGRARRAARRACRSTRASRPAARRSTRSSGSGRSSASTASSFPAPVARGPGLHAQGPHSGSSPTRRARRSSCGPTQALNPT